MPTLHQLCLKKANRVIIRRKSPSLIIVNCPHKKGTCEKPRIMKPKKPNSAQRKVIKVVFAKKKISVLAAIPGEGHNLQQFSTVLVKVGRVRDLPGVRHRIIRGVYDASAVEQRATSRSKYGRKRWIVQSPGLPLPLPHQK